MKNKHKKLPETFNYDNLNKIIEILKNTKEENFHMHNWIVTESMLWRKDLPSYDNKCGTVCCIIGTAFWSKDLPTMIDGFEYKPKHTEMLTSSVISHGVLRL